MFAGETIVGGGTMIGRVTVVARRMEASGTSRWTTRSSFNWVNRVPRVKWTRINQRQIIESLAVNRRLVHFSPTFDPRCLFRVEELDSTFFLTFYFFIFFSSIPAKGYPDNCQIATRAWEGSLSLSHAIPRDSLIADDNQSARVLEPNSSPIRARFPKRTDISPLPLIGGFPRNALDDPTFNPSRFAYKCNQLCLR